MDNQSGTRVSVQQGATCWAGIKAKSRSSVGCKVPSSCGLVVERFVVDFDRSWISRLRDQAGGHRAANSVIVLGNSDKGSCNHCTRIAEVRE